jgi:hypothetical protein
MLFCIAVVFFRPKKTPLALPYGVFPKAAQPPSTTNVRWFSSTKKAITNTPMSRAICGAICGTEIGQALDRVLVLKLLYEVVHSWANSSAPEQEIN